MIYPDFYDNEKVLPLFEKDKVARNLVLLP